ncbi:MAG: 4-aminobutyrate--2-oxoglutarate transaminase [Oxalobacteraceae bacterium]|nr:4-aminobutyrate--2-oxoglutarate transaminase [Oxalobacteraceae bacterium]
MELSNQALQQRKEAATVRGVGVMTQIYVDHAKNAEVWDVEGRRYIDFTGGIGVLNTGHCHPKIVAAVEAQLQKFTHTCFQVFPYQGYVELAEKLNQITPGSHAKRTALFSTGAEAAENAVKIARVATGRSGIIAFSGAFHGRTMMGMALTGKVVPYKAGFGPFPADVYHAPFPVALHGVTVDDSLQALDRLFKADIDPKRVAAIFIEPIQGEGGFYPTPPEFMRQLRAICDLHGILLVADEVQSGFARTGKMFAIEHYDVIPDLVMMAKSLAGGFPLSALTGRAEIMDVANPGGLGGTYAGNPLAVAAALAVLDVIEEEGLIARANQLGAQLCSRLEGLRSQVPEIADVRGLGAMVAVEFNHPGSKQPNPDFAKKVQAKALEQGLALLTCGIHFNVIRFLMPLTIQPEVFEEGLHKLALAMKA